MTAVSSLTAWVVLPDGELVWVSSAEVTLDERWSPYVQATAVVPYALTRAVVLDPRSGSPRVRLGLRRAWAGRPTADELGREWSGLTAADLSAEWVGLTAGDLSAGWLVEWESGDRASEELVLDLAVRGRTVDHGADAITVTAASDELLAQGEHAFAARPSETLTDRVNGLLAAVGLDPAGVDLVAGAAVGLEELAGESSEFVASVWDNLSGPTTGAGLRLFCDETRIWRLVDPTVAPTQTLTLTRATAGTDSIDLDSGDYADVLVQAVKAWIQNPAYPDTSPDPALLGWGLKTWPEAPPPGPNTITVIETDLTEGTKDAPPAGFGEWAFMTDAEMAARWTRLNSAGRTLTPSAPADLRVRPGWAITTGAPSLPALDGVIAAVTFRIPEDTMTITTRATVEAA